MVKLAGIDHLFHRAVLLGAPDPGGADHDLQRPGGSLPALTHFRLCRSFGGDSVSGCATISYMWHGRARVT